jgi:hypothetical protein
MSMTTIELRQILSKAGLITADWWTFPDSTYAACSAFFVRANWEAWLASRPTELCVVETIAGKRVRVRPLWVSEAGDCDNLALGTVAWADTGNALKTQQTGQCRGGLAYGALFYSALPARLENFNVAGPHAINWWVDFDQQVRFFEPGQGSEVNLTQTERASAWFGIAL